MSKKKCFAYLLLCAVLFAAFVNSGCSGGGGGGGGDSSDNDDLLTVTFNSNGGSSVPSVQVRSGETIDRPDDPTRIGFTFEDWYKDNSFIDPFIFGSNGDKVYSSITLYAHWVEETEDGLRAEYALSSITPVYAHGDNPEHVTRKITLPVTTEDMPGVSIVWTTSNQSAVSSTGKVNRPQGSDLRVTLTASATVGSTTRSKEFSVNVMRRNERIRENINNYSIVDIMNMNTGNKRSHISYNQDKTQVRRIQGKFSDINIKTADDALDAIQSVHSVLGVADPYEELETSVVNYPETGPKYRFSQLYNGVQVFGRGITVSANEDGDTNFLQSSFLASSLLRNTALAASITADEAEQIVKNNYAGEVEIDSDSTEQGIYSLGEYASSPVLIYSIYASGNDDERGTVSETVYVNASSGEIIKIIPHISGFTVTGWGKIESDDDNAKVSFDIEFTLTDIFFFYMHDTQLNLQMYTSPLNWDIYFRIGSEFNLWLDKHEISAYDNIRKVLMWWRDKIGRNSISGDGAKVKVITNASKLEGQNGVNNAAWEAYRGVIYINEKPYAYRNCDYSCAAGLDVLTHESTHGVMQYEIGNLNDYLTFSDYSNFSAAINESYADIFGCIIEENWVMGESLYRNRSSYIRSIEGNDSRSTSGAYHDSVQLSRAAYFMHEDNGGNLSWNELGRLWYDSMSMGFDGTSDFNDVRAFVIWTAEALNFSDEKIYSIVEAFNRVRIEGRSVLSGVVTSGDVPVQNASVSVLEENALFHSGITTTDSEGRYTITSLDWGTYIINVNADGYVPFRTIQFIDESEDATLNINMIRQVTGDLSGRIYNAQTGELLSGVYLELREGWNNTEGDAIANRSTGSDGTYTFQNLSGYYTVNMIKEGFTASSFNVSVVGDTINQNGYMSPVMISSANYRVVLSWGEDPADLDAHITAPSSGGGTVEVYFSHKTDYDRFGNTINLDLDVIRDEDYDDNAKRYWPETITFTADTEGTYDYFVHWYRGSGSWASCGAVVRLYAGVSTEPVRTWTVPASDTTDHCWKVFTIQNGIIRDNNSFSSESHAGSYSERTSSYNGSYVRPSGFKLK